VSVLMIAVVMAVNIRGTRQGADVQNVTTGIKLVALVLISIVLLAVGHQFTVAAPAGAPAVSGMSLVSAFGLAMIGVLWSYEGWQYVTFSAGETRDPQRTFPRGIIIGTGVMIVVYLLANVGYIAALGPARAAQSDRIAADAVASLLGPLAGKLIAAVILVSMFSAANGITITTPRVYFAMARDRVFFRKMAEVHPRFGTPAVAIFWSSLWAMCLAVTGTFEQLLTYVVFVGWIFYGLGAISIFVYRRREPDMVRPFRVPGYPVTPLLFVASAAAIVVNTMVTQPGRAFLGLGIVLLGAPVFFIWRFRSRRQAGEALESS